MSHYLDLKKAETIKLAMTFCCLLFPLLGALIGGIVFGTAGYAGIGLLAGIVCSYFAITAIQHFLKIRCPHCSSAQLRENYANTLRGSNSNVEHYCEKCNSKFIDGVRE